MEVVLKMAFFSFLGLPGPVFSTVGKEKRSEDFP